MLFGFAAPILRQKPEARRPGPPASNQPPFTTLFFVQHPFVTVLAVLLVTIAQRHAAAANSDFIDLRPATKIGTHRQAKVVVEVEGKLKLNADGQDLQHLPLKAHAELQYVERVLAQTKQWAEVRLVRSYQSAQAKIRLRETDLTNELRDQRRLVVVDSDSKQAVLFSPLGPLTREELELVEAPASGIALETLLPLRVIKIGGQWPLAEAAVARLLGLEAVSQQDVVCTLDSVKDGLAIVSLAGKVAGAVGGVSSDIELKGKLNFDLRQRAVTWLTLAYKENRAVGHAQPGFEVVTTLRMVCAPTQALAELSDKTLAGLPLKSGSGETLIELTAESAGFGLTHDRRWQVMLQRHDATILRLVDRGDLIAQCNLSPLPPLASGEQLTLEGFQDDVKRALGKNFEQISEASEEASDDGIRILRVIVAGSAGELPIHWMYYHLSDDHGHRASLVFTIEASLFPRFGHIDRELVGGFHFLPDKEPTLAPANGPRKVQRATETTVK